MSTARISQCPFNAVHARCADPPDASSHGRTHALCAPAGGCIRIVLGEHDAHTEVPQPRQWCRRTSSVKSLLQTAQRSRSAHSPFGTALGAARCDIEDELAVLLLALGAACVKSREGAVGFGPRTFIGTLLK